MAKSKAIAIKQLPLRSYVVYLNIKIDRKANSNDYGCLLFYDG